MNSEDGDGCPNALKRLACMVILEATIFLRETFRSYTKEVLSKQKHMPSGAHHSHQHPSLSPVLSGGNGGGSSHNAALPSASPSVGSRKHGEHPSDSVNGSLSSLDQQHYHHESSKFRLC